MKDFVKKLQKDLKSLETAVKKDSDELLRKVKSYATKENLAAAGVEIEKVLEKKLKEFEPTINRVVGEIKKNAAKAGINVDSLESTVRSTVKKATAKVRAASAKTGEDVNKAVEQVKTAAVKAKKTAEPVAKKVVQNVAKKVTKKAKAKTPSTKAATIRKPTTKKVKNR